MSAVPARAGSQRGPEGTLASQDNSRRFGVCEAWTGWMQGGERLTPHMDAAVDTQLPQEALAS